MLSCPNRWAMSNHNTAFEPVLMKPHITDPYNPYIMSLNLWNHVCLCQFAQNETWKLFSIVLV